MSAFSELLAAPALFSWCEDKYVHHPLVAEFHNTVSNVPYVCVGLLTVGTAWRSPSLVSGRAFDVYRQCPIYLPTCLHALPCADTPITLVRIHLQLSLY